MFFSTFQIWDVGIKIQASGIIVKGWHGTFIPHFHAHIPGSHVQWPGLSLVAKWKYIPDGSTKQLKRVKWILQSLCQHVQVYFFPVYIRFPSVPVLRPVAFASFRAFWLSFSRRSRSGTSRGFWDNCGRVVQYIYPEGAYLEANLKGQGYRMG